VKKAPFSSQGWSLYLAQDISKKHSLFFRLNSANSQYPTINRSYSFGILIDNPFNLSSKDKFALGYSINKINPKAFDDKIYNRYECIIESYYTHNINKRMSITPNIQLYLNRALSDDNKPSAVFSLNMQFNF